jgi:hypothetical protein
VFCLFCVQKNSLQRIFIKKIFPLYSGKCLSRKAVHNGIKKFSQGRSKVTDDARAGGFFETATEATVRRVEELIRADRRITIDSVATALGCSHSLTYSNISYGMQMQEKLCLTGLLLGTNPGASLPTRIKACFSAMETTNFTFNQKSLRLHHQLGRFYSPCFGILTEYC